MVHTLFPEPKTASQAAYVQRIVDRAIRLEEDGYRIQQMGRSKWYAIFKPGNTNTKNAYRDYLVDMTAHKQSCDCPGFDDGDCKHRIAVQERLRMEEAQVAAREQLEMEMEQAENPITGVDYRY